MKGLFVCDIRSGEFKKDLFKGEKRADVKEDTPLPSNHAQPRTKTKRLTTRTVKWIAEDYDCHKDYLRRDYKLMDTT
jgi:hypothetical protein